MSWLQEGWRLLARGAEPAHTESTAEQNNSTKPNAAAAAAATSPTRLHLPKALFRLTSRSPRSRSGSAEPQAAAQQQQQQPQPAALSPVYASLPCISDRSPSSSAAAELAGGVAAALPGIRLDSSWLVYPTGPGSPSARAAEGCVCIWPDLQPPGYFHSAAAVITFLQQLQDAGASLPGVLNQPEVAPSPASAQRHSAAVTAALQGCGLGFTFIDASDSVRDSSGSGDTATAAAAPAGAAGAAAGAGARAEEVDEPLPAPRLVGSKWARPLEPDQHLQQLQQLQEELKLFGGADSQGGSDGQQEQQRPLKRSRYSPAESSLDRRSSGAVSPPSVGVSPRGRPGDNRPAAAAAAGAAAVAGGAAAAGRAPGRSPRASFDGHTSSLPPAGFAAGRRPGAAAGAAAEGGPLSAFMSPGSGKPLRAAAAAAPGAWLIHSDDSDNEQADWAALRRQQEQPAGQGARVQRLNRVDAKLASVRRAALVLGLEPSLSAEMAAPRGRGRPPKASAAAAAAGGASAGLPPRPKLGSSSSGGGGRRAPSTNTFTAASDVKAMSKLDSLLRAKEAAAAIKAAVQSGQQYEGTLEQRHHAMRQQLRQQLLDGRVPSAEGLAALQAALSAHLPGARLDSEWLVYPATPQEVVPKLDILIRHPRLTQGYFRSYRSVVNFYASLTDLVKSGKGSSSYYLPLEPVLPGLSLLPDLLQQQLQQGARLGRSPGEMATLANKALGAAGRSFVRDGLIAAAAAAAEERRRPSSPGDSSGGAAGYPAGGTKAAAANAAALTVRQWQPPPLVANLEPPRKGSSVLVLGMFYACEVTAMESHSGLAQYRDRIRLAALHRQVGYIPHSFDRDHEVALAELAPDERGEETRLHVQGNFNSKRGAAAVTDRFPNTRFTAVFCDYFRMPSGYAGDIYKSQLFLDFIPELVRRGNLPAGVPVYIPNSPVLLEQLAASGAFVDYGDVVAVPARCYPLYEATRHAESAGLMPAKYSNAGQVRELVPGAEFIVVHYCGDATPPMGP